MAKFNTKAARVKQLREERKYALADFKHQYSRVHTHLWRGDRKKFFAAKKQAKIARDFLVDAEANLWGYGVKFSPRAKQVDGELKFLNKLSRAGGWKK